MPHLIAPSGIDWHYEMEGHGAPVLFIHGWGVNSKIWRQQVKSLSSSFKVISVDLPGHGETNWQLISIEQIAQDINYVLEKSGIHQVAVIASSFGGLVALKITELFPLKIRKMSLVGSQPKFSQSSDYPYGIEVARIQKLAGQLNSNYPTIIHIFFRSLFTRQERESRRFKWIQTFRRTEDVPAKEALLGLLNVLIHVDLMGALDSLDIPLQFVYGRDDYLCPRELQEYLRIKFPKARFDYFEKCGHFPFLTKPHEFNRVLEEFLLGGREIELCHL